MFQINKRWLTVTICATTALIAVGNTSPADAKYWFQKGEKTAAPAAQQTSAPHGSATTASSTGHATASTAASSHAATSAAPQTASASTAPSADRPRVKAQVIINAPREVVWQSVHEERKHDPDLAYSKVLKEEPNASQLEQKFVLLPVIGTAVCVMDTAEVPLQRIDYKLVKSDRFKAMEGSWVLTSIEDGKKTALELSTHIDLGMPVPRAFMNAVTSKKLEKRLNRVKQMAETTHARTIAQKGNAPAQ